MNDNYLKELISKNQKDIIHKEKDKIELEKSRKREGFECEQCGLCCFQTEHVDICLEDIKRWKSIGREDLFSDDMIKEWYYFGTSGLFRNEKTSRCPFLKKRLNKNEYYCNIQEIKPLFCRQFPQNKKNAKEFCNCPGYE